MLVCELQCVSVFWLRLVVRCCMVCLWFLLFCVRVFCSTCVCFVCGGLYRVAYVYLMVCVSVCLLKDESVVCLIYCMVMYSCFCCFVLVCGLSKRVCVWLFVVYCVMWFGTVFVLFCRCCVYVVVCFVCDRMCDAVWLVVADCVCVSGLKKHMCVSVVWDLICMS